MADFAMSSGLVDIPRRVAEVFGMEKLLWIFEIDPAHHWIRQTPSQKLLGIFRLRLDNILRNRNVLVFFLPHPW
jgi:hypothetical protein